MSRNKGDETPATQQERTRVGISKSAPSSSNDPFPTTDARVDASRGRLRSQGETGKAAAPKGEGPPTGPGKPAPGTLAKGGMSPVADRKDPDAWHKSSRNVLVTGKAEQRTASATARPPPEPVGGWVDASTGRAKIYLPDVATEKLSVQRLTLSDRLDLVRSTPPDVVDEPTPSEEPGADRPRDASDKTAAKAKGRPQEDAAA